jgi:dihydrofolate reductase
MTSRNWRGRVFIGTSADGKIARDDGTLEWLTDPPIRHHDVATTTDRPALVWETFFETVDAIVMGRATYESVLGFGEWPFEGRHVLVLTSGSDIVDSRVRAAASIEHVIRLLEELGARDVYIDGGRTIQSFLRAGLVDELTLSVAPVILGSGRSLFGELDADVLLTVRGSHATDDGLVRTTYDVVTAS